MALERKNESPIRILEIGTGSGIVKMFESFDNKPQFYHFCSISYKMLISGANLEYYPSNCSIIAVEPNPLFETTFRDNVKKVKKDTRFISSLELSQIGRVGS
jgi:hypothetical protein